MSQFYANYPVEGGGGGGVSSLNGLTGALTLVGGNAITITAASPGSSDITIALNPTDIHDLYDNSDVLSVDGVNRQLVFTDGTTNMLDWNTTNQITMLSDVFVSIAHHSSFWGANVPGIFVDSAAFPTPFNNPFFFASSDLTSGPTMIVGLLTGDNNSTSFNSDITGDIYISTGDQNNSTGSGTSGNFFWNTGATNGTGNTGQILLATGGAFGSAGSTGAVTITSGTTAATGNTGQVTLSSGIASGSAGNTGEITINSGNSAAGSSGNVLVKIGTASGSRGKIQLQDGTEGTSGQVWTSTDSSGSGAWAAVVSSGANTALSNLAAVAINTSLLPGTTNSINLGSDTDVWASMYSAATRTGALTTVSGIGSITVGNNLALSSNAITGLSNPTNAQDAATKSYVDSSVAALNPATACFAASTGNIAGTYNNGSSGVGATFTTTSTSTFTIDGTTPSLGVRLLFKDQSSGFQNGIYSFTTLPVGGISGAVFTRALDYNTPSDMNTAGLIPIISGTVNALSSWQQIAVITTIGTDSLVFAEFTANPSLYLLKANNLSDVASKTTSFNNLSPMSLLGDVIYGGTSGSGTALAGNITSTKKFLSQVGTGSISAAPSWSQPAFTDITGTLAVNAGGTGQTSYTDGQLLIGNSSGNTLTKSTITAGAGITVTNGNGSITIASSSGAGLDYNFTSQTGDYNAQINDWVVCSANSFAVTLPDATLTPGQSIVIQHNGASLDQVYTLNTLASQTINSLASGVYILSTHGETLTVVSIAGNWSILDHITETGWITFGNAINYYTFTVTAANATIGATYTNNGHTYTVCKTIAAGTTLIMQGPADPLPTGTLTKSGGTGDATITYSSEVGSANTMSATTTTPTFFGTPTTNSYKWKRSGSSVVLWFSFYQATAGPSAGSGDYIFPMPTNMLIDTSVIPTFTGGTAQSANGTVAANTSAYWSGPVGGYCSTNGANYYQPQIATPFSTTSYRVFGMYNAGQLQSLGSTYIATTGVIAYNFQITFPVSGWQP